MRRRRKSVVSTVASTSSATVDTLSHRGIRGFDKLNHSSIRFDWRLDLFLLIERTTNLDWMLLTKRPENIRRFIPPSWRDYGCPANVWLGCTVVNQAEADRDIPKLLAVPARVRFLSMEPLLGPVDIEPWLAWPIGGCELPDGRYFGCADCDGEAPRCKCPRDRAHFDITEGPRDETGCPEYVHAERITIDLVIVGGESGPAARPMHPDWARSLRDQCNAAGVAFHFKQWGEWAPWDDDNWSLPGGCDDVEAHDRAIEIGGCEFLKVGKKRAGRLLDGRTWDQMPGDMG